MANLRQGIFGDYYGSYASESEPLNNTEKEVNALYINSYLRYRGWSANAVAGLLGNMQAESSFNPGRWQSEDIGNTSGGYGLVQWTPATKYFNWCNEQGYSDYSEMDTNLARIIYEVENGLQWIPASSYNLSFEEFTTSTLSVEYLSKAFLLNYERPADQSSSVQEYRASLSVAWYEYLNGEIPSEPEPENPSIPGRKKYKFILFNRRKQWTRKHF